MGLGGNIIIIIHDKNKRRGIEACSITHHNTIPQQKCFVSRFRHSEIFMGCFQM